MRPESLTVWILGANKKNQLCMEKECTRRIMKGSQKQLRVLNVLRKLWVGTKANLERQEQEVQPLSFYQDYLAVMPMAVNTALWGQHCHWLLLPQGTRVTGNHSGRHEWSVSTSLSLCRSRHSQSWVEAKSQSHTACWLLVFTEWEGSSRKRVQTLCRRPVHFSSGNRSPLAHLHAMRTSFFPSCVPFLSLSCFTHWDLQYHV